MDSGSDASRSYLRIVSAREGYFWEKREYCEKSVYHRWIFDWT